MNEKNYDFLKNQIKFTGFGEGHEQELKEFIQSGKEDFKIEHRQKFGTDDTVSTLHFKKSAQSDMYFLNNFELGLKTPNKDEVLTQNYFINNENNLTLKERYNLLSGRAVHKEFNRLEEVNEAGGIRFKPTGETYMAWAELNFKQTDKHGNFIERKLFDYNLERALAKYPVKELADNYDRTRLIGSLEKGNLQKATLVVDGQESKALLAANPRDKGVIFYDEKMQRLEVKQVPGQKQGHEQGLDNQVAQGQKEQQKNNLKEESAPNNKQAETKRRSMRVS
jgi:hypothetical protein